MSGDGADLPQVQSVWRGTRGTADCIMNIIVSEFTKEIYSGLSTLPGKLLETTVDNSWRAPTPSRALPYLNLLICRIFIKGTVLTGYTGFKRPGRDKPSARLHER
jgi:hypothetical protein